MTADEQMTAALLFWDELGSERLQTGEPMQNKAVERAVSAPGRISTPACLLDRLAMKTGLIGYERSSLSPYVRAREAVLGSEAKGKPRMLVRVDEFPHYRAWDESGRFGTDEFRRFHEIMSGADIPYLVSLLPCVARNPLDPRETKERPLDAGELSMIEELKASGTAFGLHGWSHRTRRPEPRRRSELAGLDDVQLRELLDRARLVTDDLGIETRVFVPPFNRFDPDQLALLASRFDVLCGGPETVSLLGFRKTPSVISGSVFLPSYPPFYGRSEEISAALPRLAGVDSPIWVPVVLHWGWEAESGWRELERLAPELARFAVDWRGFLAAARGTTASRAGA